MTDSANPPNPAGTSPADVIISYDCLPKIGGAHLWLYEVYRRWPSPVRLFTAEYSNDSAVAAAERAFDADSHGAITIHRLARPFEKLSLLSPSCMARYAAHVLAISRLAGKGQARLHALRSFPEGFAGLLHKWLHRRTTQLITYAHGEEILIAHMSRQLRWMAQQVYGGSDLVIANSASTRNLVMALCPHAKVVCITPGVDVQSFDLPSAQISEYRRKWSWPKETVVISTVARMEPRKNQAAVLRSIAQLRVKGLPVAYVCAGDGQERGNLMQLAAELGIRDSVHFPGAVSDTEKRLIFAACDIHAMPSIQIAEMIEGFGIVFLEAAAAGVPSICGNTGGQTEAVRHAETGLVVDGSDSADVARAVERLAQNPDLRREMGSRGRQWAAQYDWERIADRVLQETRRLVTPR